MSFMQSKHQRQLGTFVLVGAGVAVAGHEMLQALVAWGIPPWAANVIQIVATLQLNFALNLLFTWREQIAGSRIGLIRRWWRFQVGRGAGLALNVAAFPLLVPHLGVTASYWLLFVVCGAVNYLSDRHWSFAGHETRRGWGIAVRLGIVVILAVAASLASLDAVILTVSFLMLAVMATTLVFQLYHWWFPEHAEPGAYGQPDRPRLRGAILVPMRHEEAVAAETLERLATLNHPDYWVVPIIDHPDDPGTARIAHEAARRHPDRILVCRYPEDTNVHNKPIALNAAIEMLDDVGLQLDWVGIADAEDVFHPDLLEMVDHRFRATGAGIVQSGVQLMNFSCDAGPQQGPDLAEQVSPLAPLRRWWRANSSGWWRAANVLEYFKWFQSRLKLQAVLGVMPLGGNTVFFRRHVLDDLRERHGAYWDEGCLTEDCKIGISASVLGHAVDVVYVPALVTREETPPSLPALFHQRVRWMQGFIQVFLNGEWRHLPTRGQRVLAVYVLGFQFFQAASFVLVPVALGMALAHKSATVVALFSTLPLGLSTVSIALDVLLLKLFSQTFEAKARWRDYVGVVLGAYPYQVVLAVAAAWAVVRAVTGRDNWVKTEHVGAHREASDEFVAAEASELAA